jgi:hypothetical protein
MTINRKETEALYALINAGMRLRPKGSDWYYIEKRYVQNARYNEDQTAVLPGDVIAWRNHGSSAVKVDYKHFVWLINTIFDDVEEFDVEYKENE